MLTARVGIVSQSAAVPYTDVVRVAQALNLQVSRDLGPIWRVSGTVMALESADHLDPGVWPVYIVDEVQSGAAGFHLTEHNQPFAVVLAGDTWSLSASHEVLEMLVDPSGNRLTAANAVAIVDNEVQDSDGKVEFLVEICDPSEDASNAYLIDTVLVSDFYTPHYFDPAGTWALTNADPKAPVWIYPNSYHIKVAVREDDTFWLSSGNWNNSNQPEIDLSDVTAARKLATTHDRDWHVIVTSKALADTFRAFLQHDYTVSHDMIVATQEQRMAVAEHGATALDVPIEALAAGKTPRQFFAPKTLTDTVQIQPLLTPDNYQPHVQALIESAQQRFYMQTQYIHPSGNPADAQHDALIAAVKALIDRGIDVRLITSQFQNDAWVEKLVAAGIPSSVLRRQANVHNKGIVVDGSVVMVSSQNWSADGTLRNRDAGLIIYNTDAAAYFEQIFLHDWDYLASPVGN